MTFTSSEVPEVAATKAPVQHVIVCQSYGAVRVVAATVANAMVYYAAFKDNLPLEALTLLVPDATKYAVSAETLVDILKDISYRLPVGTPLPQLRNMFYGGRDITKEDTRPEVVITQEMADSVVLWAGRGGFLLKELRYRHVMDFGAATHFPFLKRPDGRDWHIVESPETFEIARQIRTIRDGRWSAKAQEHQKAAFIVNFVKDNLANRDVSILEVVPVGAAA